MELKVNIVTITKCTPKGKEPYTRIDYIATEKPCKSDKVKGFIVSFAFLPADAFEKLDKDLINNESVLLIDMVENPMNPMRPKVKIIGIKFKDETIDLL